MPHISIISSSVRIERKSHRVALYLKNYLIENNLATTEILDLSQYNFPIFKERLKFQNKPAKKTLEFAHKIIEADGVIIVTPEYNGGYPASLKNAIDMLDDNLYHKPIAISTVSKGNYGGSQVITSLQFSLWKMQVLTADTLFPVSKVEDAFDEFGNPTDKNKTDKRANSFITELLWCIEAKRRMSAP